MEREQRQQPRDLDAPHHRVPVVPAEQVLGRAPGGGGQALHRRQLDRLVDRHVAGGPVADDHLQRRRHRGGRHRDAERNPLIPAAPPAQEAPGVRARQQETADDEGGEVHVRVIAPEHRVVEQRPPRMHVHRPAVLQGESRRVVHPAVDRDDEERPRDPGDRDRDAAPEVHPRPQPVPSVGVDPDEDGLDEEREPLQREPEPEHVPEVLNPDGPQQPELERQDRPGHHPDREQRQHDPRPPPGQRPVDLIAGAQVPVLREQHEHRERNPEAHQRNVHRQRQCLHLPGFVEVVLIHSHSSQPYACTTSRSSRGPIPPHTPTDPQKTKESKINPTKHPALNGPLLRAIRPGHRPSPGDHQRPQATRPSRRQPSQPCPPPAPPSTQNPARPRRSRLAAPAARHPPACPRCAASAASPAQHPQLTKK